MKTTADRLRWLREKVAKIERPELEWLAELTKGHIWLIEHGEREKIAAGTATKIAGVLACREWWLMTGEGEPPLESEVLAAVSDARIRRPVPPPSPTRVDV